MDDSISRQVAIDAVRKCLVKEVTPAYMLIDKTEVMTELMLLPPAEPERKKDDETMLTIEQKKHVDAFEYWVKTNTEDGVSILPESICKDIIAILRHKGGDDNE